MKLLSSIQVSRSSTSPSATKQKLAVLKWLGNREVAAIFKMVVLNISTLPRAVKVSIT